MLPLRYPAAWRMASILLLLIVLGVTLMPAVWSWPERGRLLDWLIGADKWQHGVTFVVLTLWFTGLYRSRSYWKIALALIVFGVFIEACQQLLSYRSSELLDILADGLGILFGLLLARMGLGGWSQRFERWLQSHIPRTDID